MSLDWVWVHVFARRIVVLGSRKAPAFLGHVPVHRGVWDDILQSLEFADYEGAVCPGTSIANIKMIPPLLGWKLCSSFFRNLASENRCAALEFPGFVGWVDPVGDFLCLVPVSVYAPHAHVGVPVLICFGVDVEYIPWWKLC